MPILPYLEFEKRRGGGKTERKEKGTKEEKMEMVWGKQDINKFQIKKINFKNFDKKLG